MAIYHLSVKTVSRSTGRSAVAAAAYRTGTRLTNERDGVVHDYRRRQKSVMAAFIIAPAAAGAWALDRSTLWNRAEAAETRKNSTVAREYELALPSELSPADQEALARQFAQTVVDRFGVVADVAIHKPGKDGDRRNCHTHILTTTRAATETGLGAKTRMLDDRATGPGIVVELRETWASQVNAALERAQISARVDHRSHADRGIEAIPQRQNGPARTAIARRLAAKLRIARHAASQALIQGRARLRRAVRAVSGQPSAGWARRTASAPVAASELLLAPAPAPAPAVMPEPAQPRPVGRLLASMKARIAEKQNTPRPPPAFAYQPSVPLPPFQPQQPPDDTSDDWTPSP